MPFWRVTLAGKTHTVELPVWPCLFCDRFVFSRFISCRQAVSPNVLLFASDPSRPTIAKVSSENNRIVFGFGLQRFFRHITFLGRFSKRLPFPLTRRSVFYFDYRPEFRISEVNSAERATISFRHEFKSRFPWTL